MKALGLEVSDKIFENCILEPTGTVWTTLVEGHPGIISVKFGQNPMSGFREEVVWMKKFTHAHTHWRTKDCHNMNVSFAKF